MNHLNNGFKVGRIAGFIFFICFLMACHNGQENQSGGGKQSESIAPIAMSAENTGQVKTSGKLARIILLTTSKGCECTMTRCKNGEAAFNEAIAKLTKAPPLERVDFAKDLKRTRELIGKYPASLLPVIYFLDSDQNLLWKVEGYFDRAEISRALQQYWGDNP